MGEKIKQFVKNRYGINIVKCCASCNYKVNKGDDKTRYCTKYGKKFKKNYLCAKGWEMHPSYLNAGGVSK